MPDDLVARCAAEVRRAITQHGYDFLLGPTHAASFATTLGRMMAAGQEPLLRFAGKVIDASREGAEPDGGDIQDWAVEAGLLVPTPVTESCGEGCSCAEWDDFPQTCYKDSAALRAIQRERGGTA